MLSPTRREALNAICLSRCDVTAPDEDRAEQGLFARESLDAVLCLSVTKWIQLNRETRV